MSCSSKRNRLVGSCISTLVSSTNSLLADAWPVLAGLREGRRCSVDGAGRSLRSTMGLQESRDGPARFHLAPEFRVIQAIVVVKPEIWATLWCKADNAFAWSDTRLSRMPPPRGLFEAQTRDVLRLRLTVGRAADEIVALPCVLQRLRRAIERAREVGAPLRPGA